MVRVIFEYELVDKMGSTLASFWKEIEMPVAPTKDLVFDDQDFTWEANRSIQYSFQTQAYFVRHVDPFSNLLEMSDMFKERGWENRKSNAEVTV